LELSQDIGTVEKGKIADLLILDANPLDNIDNVFQQDGVIVHGRWFSKDELQNNLTMALQQSRADAGE
jgi:imidazolonepropionase-like amidohydrolase